MDRMLLASNNALISYKQWLKDDYWLIHIHRLTCMFLFCVKHAAGTVHVQRCVAFFFFPSPIPGGHKDLAAPPGGGAGLRLAATLIYEPLLRIKHPAFTHTKKYSIKRSIRNHPHRRIHRELSDCLLRKRTPRRGKWPKATGKGEV